MIVMVTGGCGFIGSNYIEYLLSNPLEVHRIVNVDSLTYAGKHHINDPKIVFEQSDIGSRGRMRHLLEKYQPNVIVNFAAETHVDRSIDDSTPFLESNIIGVHNLLCELRTYMDIAPQGFKLVHISTDEVYGALENDSTSAFTEESNYNPNSPYAASKAAADHLVRAFYKTHSVPSIVVHCSNNYGPRQHSEKFIPTIITNALLDKPTPIYGQGLNIRDWLYVTDSCEAIFKIMNSDFIGHHFNVGTSHTEVTNINLVQGLLTLLDKPLELIQFVDDRLGHDFRYALDSSKIKRMLNWQATTSLVTGLKKTIQWYTHV